MLDFLSNVLLQRPFPFMLLTVEATFSRRFSPDCWRFLPNSSIIIDLALQIQIILMISYVIKFLQMNAFN